MEKDKIACFLWILLVLGIILPLTVFCETIGPMKITENHKCQTCGMRVAEFENWHTQIVYDDGTNDGFCAVKCLMAFYFEPLKYSKEDKTSKIKMLYAKDYYNQNWYEMKNMVYVMGSDVMGPMGKDLVPFFNKAQAKTFMEDHNGSDMLAFDEITLELIQKLRKKKNKGL